MALSQHQVVEKELDFETAIRKLIVFCEEERSIHEMMNFMGWSDRTKFRKKFIYLLIEKGIIKMTIPEKPKSSNPRYVTTPSNAE